MTSQDFTEYFLKNANSPKLEKLLQQHKKQLSLDTIEAILQQAIKIHHQQPKQALKIISLAQNAAVVSGLPEAKARVAWINGVVQAQLLDYDAAQISLRQAENFYREDGQFAKVLFLLGNQIVILRNLGDFESAIQLAEAARQLGESLPVKEQAGLAPVDMNVAWAYQRTGRYDEAMAAYQQARKRYSAEQKDIQIALVDSAQALLYQELGKFDQAHEKLTASFNVFVAHEMHQHVARKHLNFGVLAHLQGDYQRAWEQLAQARDGFVAIPNPIEVAVVDLFRSYVYHDLNLLPEAAELANRSQNVLKKSSLQWNRALALMNLGETYLKLDYFELAGDSLDKARRLLKQMGAQPTVLSCDLIRAELAFKRGLFNRAKRIARRVERQALPKAQQLQRIRAQLFLAQVAIEETPAQLALAYDWLKQARALNEQYQIYQNTIKIYELAGRLAEHDGNFEEATQQYDTAVAFLEWWRAHLRLDEFQVGFMDDKLSVYQAVVHLNHKQAVLTQSYDPLLDALNRINFASLPALHPQINDEKHLDAAQEERLLQLRQRWHFFNNRVEQGRGIQAVSADAHSQNNLTSLNQQLYDIEQEIAELVRQEELLIRSRNNERKGGFGEQRLPQNYSERIKIADVQQCLSPSQIVVDYYLIDGFCHILLISKDTVALVEDLAQVTRINELIETWEFYIDFIATMPIGFDESQAQVYLNYLYQALIQPIQSYLKNHSELLIILPVAWQALSFAAFYDGTHYLVEHFNVTYLSAPSVLIENQDNLGKIGQDLQTAVIGYSDSGRLPHAVAEATAVSQLLDHKYKNHLLLEEEATTSQFKQIAQESKIIHLATHALYRPDNPMFSWIRFADERLTVTDIYRLPLSQAPLVVLSACETAKGKPWGGGLFGMARGFLAAGASGLIVSQWFLEDETSSQIMIDFYAQWSKNQWQTAVALAQAQRQGFAQSTHPFFWAGYKYILG